MTIHYKLTPKLCPVKYQMRCSDFRAGEAKPAAMAAVAFAAGLDMGFFLKKLNNPAQIQMRGIFREDRWLVNT